MDPVEPLFLGGEFDQTVDEKNRVSVPAELRRMIDTQEYGEHLVALVGTNGKPWLYPDKYYRRLLSKFTPRAVPPEDLLRFDHFNVSMTFAVAVDKTGRMVLPEKIVRRTNIGGEVTIAGARDHIEIWPRAEWEKYCNSMMTNPGDLALKARIAINQVQQGQGDQLL